MMEFYYGEHNILLLCTFQNTTLNEKRVLSNDGSIGLATKIFLKTSSTASTDENCCT